MRNPTAPWADWWGMRCEDCRDAISAQLDGEDGPGEAAAVEAHLAWCRACRAYAERAARVTRLARTGLAEPVPDLVGAVLAAAPGPVRRRWPVRGVRVLLGALGIGQAGLAISGIVTAGHAHPGAVELAGASVGHFVHESAAWNLALAVAFLLAATGVARVVGLVPVLGAFVGALAVLSVMDLFGGRVEVERLAGHGLAVAGFLLLVALPRRADDGGGGSGRRVVSRAGRTAAPVPAVAPSSASGDGPAPMASRRAA
ncbi:hypothetical protein BJF78_23405 [Pseudonocardia sp. CNS-139]|nr:hypothetical protein BJF78_23405 [Pseudonocardia sp. CNS-139]